MDWKVISYLSLPPLMMGPLSVFGLTQVIEPYLWFLFACAAASVLVQKRTPRLLAHTLIIGVLWGLINGVIQSLFFVTYLENNPAYAEQMKHVELMNPRLFPLFAGPGPGLVIGGFMCAIALGMKRALSNRSIDSRPSS